MENRKKGFWPNAWVIQGISIIIIIGMALWTARQTGVLSQIGTEDLYWERARFILGEDGATLYTGASICSLGYSLLLVPICALIKSPYGAYKAAVLLNGFLLCLAYLAAVKTARKIFSRENGSFLSASCFFAVFTPALFASRTYTGPEMAVLFLTWLSLYLLAAIWKAPRRFRQRLYWRLHLALLAVCMILIGFFQITALGVILAVTLLLAYYVKKRKIEENSFLLFILAVLLGLAAGNIAERVFLYQFSANLEITTVRSSLEVFLNTIGKLQETDYLYTLFATLGGKFYSLLIASFLFLCPALWLFCRKIFGRVFTASAQAKNDQNASLTGAFSPDSDFLVCAIVYVFLAQLLFMSLYDRTGSYETSLLSLSGLEMVLSPMILLGIVCFRQIREPEKEAAGYMLLLCICTFLAGNAFQSAGTESISGVYCGFFTLFRTDGSLMKPTAAVYSAACLTLLAALLLFALLRIPFKNEDKDHEDKEHKDKDHKDKDHKDKDHKDKDREHKDHEHKNVSQTRLMTILRGSGVLLCACLSIFMNVQAVSLTAGEDSQDYLAQIAPAASLLSGTTADVDCLYFEGSAADDALVVLQSLLPDARIRVLEDDTETREQFYDGLDQEPDSLIILTGSSESVVETCADELDGYRVIFATETWAIWAQKDSQVYSELAEGAAARVENVPFQSSETEETETTVIYGGSMVLAPGTYQMNVSLHADSETEMSGTITISDGDGTLSKTSYTQEEFDSNGDAILSISFAGRDVMRKVSVTIYGTMPTGSTVSQVTCQKTSNLFTLALDTSSKLKKTTKTIKSTDKLTGTKGTVAYVDKLTDDADEFSLEVFEALLSGYEVTAVTVEELDTVEADYLIGLTDSHSYYGAMDRYSIIRRDSSYTLLVRNNSELYEACRENDMILSDGYEINISVFSSGDDTTSAITLERGDYNYHVRLAFNPDLITGKGDDIGAVVYLWSDGEEIASVEVTCEQMLERIDGITEVVIPLDLPNKTKQITCTVEMADSINAVLTPLSIELVSEMFQYGKDEDFTEIVSLIENVDKGAAVYVARTSTAKSNTHALLTYLQELVPDYPVTEITYSEAGALAGDGLLLTYDYSTNTQKLAASYSILAHAGKYTLWAKTDGEYLQELIAAGAAVLSSGSKLSPESVAAMTGIRTAEDTASEADIDTSDQADADAAEEDTSDQADADVAAGIASDIEDADTTEIIAAYLPKAQYCIYLKLTAQDLELDDTIEVFLYRDSTESEIEADIEELVDSGYTVSEAEERVSQIKQCGSTSLSACELLDTGDILISLTTSTAEMENLTCEVYTWRGASVEAEVIWIEMVL